MAFSGGTFSRLYNWVNDAASGTKILASRMDAEMNGFATGLSTCITKDGQTTATANLPMGGYRHTNVSNPLALDQYATAYELYHNEMTYVVASGTNTYTIPPSPGIDSYAAGQSFKVKFSNANTSTATLNVNGLGAKAITNRAGVALSAGQIPAGAIFDCDYDGTKFMIDTVASTEILPPGMLAPFAGTSAPTGWLLCYGQAVSRTTYAALFTAISTVYGTGDGSTTFNLPDLRGRVIAGQDDMGGSSANRLTGVSGSVNGDTLGGTGGVETVTLTSNEMPSHTHTVNDPGHLHEQNGGAGGSGNDTIAVVTGGAGQTAIVPDTDSATTGITLNNTGSGAAHNNVQPTIILNYIIKV